VHDGGSATTAKLRLRRLWSKLLLLAAGPSIYLRASQHGAKF